MSKTVFLHSDPARLPAFSLAALGLAAALAAGTAQAAPAHWDYAGPHGPDHWGELGPETHTCATGKAQSPVDILTAQVKTEATAPELGFDYHAVPLALLNNGHTVQVNEADAGSLNVGGHTYSLAQFHFHSPSEERIDGKGYDMVAHLVHKDAQGQLAVVAVLFELGHENAALNTVLNNMPLGAGPVHAVAGMDFNAAELLPAQHGYYHYSGSLTTPPCSEGVAWYVMKTPVELSAAQLARFHTLYDHTNRPVQALNGRAVIAHP